MQVFHRSSYTELWVTIRAGESLGILNTGYVEDYFGVNGQLTLRNMENDARTSFIMAEDIDETPSIPHDVFTGVIDLTTLADGIYRVEGRVRDNAGNYRILSEVQAPFGTEDITLFEVQITPLEVVIFVSPSVDLSYVPGPDVIISIEEKPSAIVTYFDRQIIADFFIPEAKACSVILREKSDCTVVLVKKPELDVINVYTKIY